MKYALLGTLVVLAWATEAGELHRAARSGDLGAVRLLLDQGADVNAKGILGDTPLHRAAKEGKKDVAELLIPHARNDLMMLGLCLETAVAWDYALPHTCLTRLGYRDSDFDDLLRQSVNSQAHAGRERVPHRMLEQEWIAGAWHQPGLTRQRTSSATSSVRHAEAGPMSLSPMFANDW